MKTVSDANLLEAVRAADPAALITVTSADAAAAVTSRCVVGNLDTVRDQLL